MKLTKFEVYYYRSIRAAKVSDIGNTLVLIGANNEGKSNILRAVRLALTVMQDVQDFQGTVLGGNRRRRLHRNYEDVVDYDWGRDFPVNLQNHAQLRDKRTKIRLNFQLSASEIDEFRGLFDLSVNGNIPVQMRFARDEFDIEIVKQGPQKQLFTRKKREIARFLSERLKFVYIPPVRTSEVATEIINNVVRQRVREKQRAIIRRVENELQQAQMEVFDELSGELKETMQTFIPDISDVRIEGDRRFLPYTDRVGFEVNVNDGQMTPIGLKGDGVQSLVSLALMRSGTGEREDAVGATIFAIEEPEAHLNSAAIHKLREAILAGSEKNQIILTTHSPIFVTPANLGANILVRDSKATPAKSISEVRTALGVRVPENLVSAAQILFVEGPLDRDFFLEVLGENAEIDKLLESGVLRVEPLTGAANLVHSCRHYAQLSCEAFAFLDGDPEGRDAFERAQKDGSISGNRVRFTRSVGRSTSELEDMYCEVEYDKVLRSHGLLPDREFATHGGKWTVRAKNLAHRLGVPWTEATENSLKQEIGKHLAGRRMAALSVEGRKAVDAVCSMLLGTK